MDQTNPKEKASFLSLMFLSWMNSLIKLANQRPLAEDDLFELCDEDRAEFIVEDFEEAWNNEIEYAQKYGRQPRLWKAMARFIPWRDYIWLTALRISDALLSVSSSLLLWFYLKCDVEESLQTTQYLLIAAVGIGLSNLFQVFTSCHTSLRAELIGMRLKIACIGVTYKKILQLNRYNLPKETAGRVFNMVSNDAHRMEKIISRSVFVAFSLVDSLLAILLLCTLVGWQSISGAFVVLAFCCIQFGVCRILATYRTKQAAATDKRLTAMNEIITGIRTVKMYAWEWNYSDIIKILRRKEVNLVFIKSAILTFIKTVFLTINMIATLVSIITMLYWGIHLTAVNVFTLVSILHLMTSSTNLQMIGIIYLNESLASIKRIEQHLLNYQDPSSVKHSKGDHEVKVTNVIMKTLKSFSSILQKGFSKDNQANSSNLKYTPLKNVEESFLPPKSAGSKDRVDPYLELVQVSSGWMDGAAPSTIHNISLKAESNILVMVTGPVGSGKSTLLMTMLREIPMNSGQISSSGKMAYVSQTPWIFTGTVRENILFGETLDQARYQKVLDACDLNPDIQQFPNGNLSMIGERGVALSGGQRVRVSLARAMYSNADIFLMDDPLSAVDAKVGQHLFDKCICGELSRKIRILVTHQLQHLHRADEIVVLKEGAILEKGSFGEIGESENLSQIIADSSNVNTTIFKEEQTDKIEKDKLENGKLLDLNEEDEDKAIGAVSWRLYWEYFRAGLPAVLIVLMFLFLAAAQASPIISTWWLKVMSKMTYQNQMSDTVLGIYGGLLCGSFIMGFLTIGFMLAAFLRSSEKLHDKMTLAILKAPVLFFDTNPVGRIMNRFSKDIGTMDDLIPSSIVTSAEKLLYCLAVLVLTGIVNYWLIIASIIAVIFFLFICRYYLKAARDLSRLESIRCSPVYAHVSETMEGLEVIHSFHMEERSVEKLYHLQNFHARAFCLAVSIRQWVGIWTDVICALFITVVAIATVFISLDPATAGFLLANVISILKQISVSILYASDVETKMVSVERVRRYTLLDAEPGYKRQKKPSQDWPDKGALSVQGLTMVYLEGGPRVLKDIDFEMKPQEKVGIAGRTGAGKSSLVAALFRMPDPQGHVLIDGVDLGSLNIQAARTSMAVISQNPVLFSATLKYNLDPFNHFAEEQIWTALEQVQMKERVSKLGGRLDYSIGKNGLGFSVGETQLLCLARALLRRCKILILDEATANVDLKTDQLVQQVLREKFAHCTVLTIAHRLNTIMDYDRVLVIDQGHVVEYDSPAVLAAKSDGVFEQLVKSFQGSV